MKKNRIYYALGAVPKRLLQPKRCPSCGAKSFICVDRKWFHDLNRCKECTLLYRWPYENVASMEKFYQHDYSQSGLTTELPDSLALQNLISSEFRGSSKDFSRVVELFETIGVPEGARVLDYGANWGYGVWQFRKAGYDAFGFELSLPRAHYGSHLGLDIYTEWNKVEALGQFDVVFSSHVLEHTPDPAAAIKQQMAILRPNGWLVAFFPNGSEPFRKAEPEAFHRLWGQVHAVMLNDSFLEILLGSLIVFLGSTHSRSLPDMTFLKDPKNSIGDLSGSEMLLLARNSPNQSDLLGNTGNP